MELILIKKYKTQILNQKNIINFFFYIDFD